MRTASALFINTLAQLVAKVVTTTATLVVTYLIARSLGTTGLGEFIASTSYVALFYLLADFGINAVFTKKVHQGLPEEIAREEAPSHLPHLFKNLLSLRLILGVGVTFLAVALLSFLGYPANIKLAIIFASLLILNQALFTTANGIFQIKLRYEFSAIAEIFGSVVMLVLVFLALKSSLGIPFIVISYVIGGVVRFLIALLLARRLVGSIGLGSDTRLWRSLFVASLPLGLMAIFSQVMGNIDKVILSLVPLSPTLGYNNIEAVGIYGLAYKFFDVSLVLPTYAMNAAFPIFVKTGRTDPVALKSMAKKLALSLVALAVVGVLVGIMLTPWVLGFFNEGEDLQGSITSLRILLLGLPLFYLSALLVWLTVALDKQKFLVFIYLFAALINVALNLLLIPSLGYLAAAYTTILSELVVVLGTSFLLWQGFKKTNGQG